MSFAQKILNWYTVNKRNLPWRGTRDPYKIWLSEIMLQQTRVAQGTPYYLKFVEAFPTVHDLADASEEKVLKLWQGLGYYSRARNLHATAQTVSGNGGDFPNTYEGLLELKGIGDYTASAIASICFDAPEPVVDGNVYRVLSRYFGIETPINSGKGIKYFKNLAREVMDSGNIHDYNQGVMEFGAVQCTPKNPDCMFCPLNDACVALKEGRVQELPVKIKKGKIRHRHFNYLVLQDSDEKFLLRKRTGKGIWRNLWEFPLLESEKPVDRKALIKELEVTGSLNNLGDSRSSKFENMRSSNNIEDSFRIEKNAKIEEGYNVEDTNVKEDSSIAGDSDSSKKNSVYSKCPDNFSEHIGRKPKRIAEPSPNKWRLNEISKYNEHPIIHKLSHQHLHTTFWIVKTGIPLRDGIPLSKLDKYPVPVLIAEFLKEFKNRV